MQKKKRVLIVAAVTTVVLGIVAMIAFLLLTAQVDISENDVKLEGSWKVIEFAGQVSEEQYFVFASDSVTVYRNQETEPYLEAKYHQKDGILTLEDLNKKFMIQKRSDNNVVLVEKDTGYEWKMIRCALDGATAKLPVKEGLEGRWNVIMHAGSHTQNEVIQFMGNHMADYRDDQVYLESKFSWESDNVLLIESLQLKLEVYPVDDQLFIMVESEDRYVWELVRE